MKNLVIRKATLKDVVPLALLARVTFREAFGKYFRNEQDLKMYFNESFSIQSLKAKLNDGNNIFWIAFVDNLPVGYAKMIKNSPSKFIGHKSVSELQRIYVLHDFLNMKIGQSLQNTVFKEVKRLGVKYLWLSVYVGNPKAIRFYQRNKYKHFGNQVLNFAQQDFEFQVLFKSF